MHVIRDKSLKGNINTDLFDIVNNLSSVPLFNLEHKLRQPLGIYTVSSSRVFKAFVNFVSLYKNSNCKHEDLSEAHSELLDSLMAFIDDGYLIMKTLFPKSSVSKDIKFAHQWLKAVDTNTKNTIIDYQEKIAPYRNRLAAIVNRIKHNHARYCYVEGKTSFGNIKGYYIEGMNENGVIVPDLEIHPEFEGRYTAISYNRDIKNYLVDFYILSSIMAKTLWKLIQQASGISLTLNPVSYEKDEEIILLCEDIQGLPNLFFSDEYYTDLPQIIVNKQNQIIEFRKPVYKSFTKSLVRIKSYRFSTLFTTDGISVSWSLPYLGKENL